MINIAEVSSSVPFPSCVWDRLETIIVQILFDTRLAGCFDSHLSTINGHHDRPHVPLAVSSTLINGLYLAWFPVAMINHAEGNHDRSWVHNLIDRLF
jgi:hypothetical protein